MTDSQQQNVYGILSVCFTGAGILCLFNFFFGITIVLGLLFLILGLIFGIIGLFKRPKALSIIGTVVSSLSLALVTVVSYFFYDFFISPVVERKDDLSLFIDKVQEYQLDEKDIDDLSDFIGKKIETDLIGMFSGENSIFEGEITSKDDLKMRIKTFIDAVIDESLLGLDEYLDARGGENIELPEVSDEEVINGESNIQE
jgi:hypothetical protein